MKINQGVYEQIIYQDLKDKLQELNIDEYYLQKEPLDVEEAKTMLSSYISSVIKKGLRFIRENNKKDDKEALLSQINVCNEIINALSKLGDEDSFQGFKIAEEGEILTALYSKIKNFKAAREDKAIRQVTQLA